MMAHPCQHRRKGAAFTLLETMLALVLASLIGATVLIMLRALGTVADERFSTRETLVNRQTVALRIGAALRAGAMVLGKSDHVLVLWRGDMNGDEVPNLSELSLIEHIASTGDVVLHIAPATLAPDDDVAYSIDDDLITMAGALAGSASFPGQVVLARVSGWEVELNAPLQEARTVRVRVTSDLPAGEDAITVVASLRGV